MKRLIHEPPNSEKSHLVSAIEVDLKNGIINEPNDVKLKKASFSYNFDPFDLNINRAAVNRLDEFEDGTA